MPLKLAELNVFFYVAIVNLLLSGGVCLGLLLLDRIDGRAMNDYTAELILFGLSLFLLGSALSLMFLKGKIFDSWEEVSGLTQTVRTSQEHFVGFCFPHVATM